MSKISITFAHGCTRMSAIVHTRAANPPSKDIEAFRCDNPELDADTFIPIFREALSSWHWWLGDYMNPLTMYPRQVWTMKYIIVPDSTSYGNKI